MFVVSKKDKDPRLGSGIKPKQKLYIDMAKSSVQVVFLLADYGHDPTGMQSPEVIVDGHRLTHYRNYSTIFRICSSWL